jgi:hypothetical protein
VARPPRPGDRTAPLRASDPWGNVASRNRGGTRAASCPEHRPRIGRPGAIERTIWDHTKTFPEASNGAPADILPTSRERAQRGQPDGAEVCLPEHCCDGSGMRAIRAAESSSHADDSPAKAQLLPDARPAVSAHLGSQIGRVQSPPRPPVIAEDHGVDSSILSPATSYSPANRAFCPPNVGRRRQICALSRHPADNCFGRDD